MMCSDCDTAGVWTEKREIKIKEENLKSSDPKALVNETLQMLQFEDDTYDFKSN